MNFLLFMNLLVILLTSQAHVNVSESPDSSTKTELELFKVLEQKHLEHEEAFGVFKSLISPANSLSKVEFKMTTLLQMVSIHRLTSNFVNILQILKGDILLVDGMLRLTKDLVRSIVEGIIKSRAPLAVEVALPIYLLPENFPLLTKLVDEAYHRCFELQGEAFVRYGEGLHELMLEFDVSPSTADALEHNTALLRQGLFMTWERAKGVELRLYREVVFPIGTQ